MIGFLRAKKHHLFSFMVMTLCGLVTTYVFLASFETVFNRNVPFVDAADSVDLQAVQRYLDNYPSVDQYKVGNYGVPKYLKLPAQNVRIEVVPGLRSENEYLARAGAAHYFLTSSDKDGNLGNAVVYFQKSWRTNDRPDQIRVGDNIFLDTDREWRYFYRIDEVRIIENGDQFIGRETPASKVLLVGVDKPGKKVIVAEASLVNVQNVRL